jgi:hypothetical protein
LVSSLDELNNAELLLIGHHFPRVGVLLQNTRAFVIDLAHPPTVPLAASKVPDLAKVIAIAS